MAALNWLCESDATLADVAFRLSYQSEAAFSRGVQTVRRDAAGRRPPRASGVDTRQRL